MAKEKKVTVVVTNYNFGDYLGECVQSILDQTYKNLEIIIVDDGSKDHSRNEIAKLSKKDDRIISVLKDNGGQASAFNAAKDHVTGDIVCFMDSDDLWVPEKVETVVGTFEKGTYAIVQHKSYIIEDGKINKSRQWPYIPKSDNVLDHFLQDNHTGFFSTTSGIATSRDLFDKVIPLEDEDQWRICADVPLTRHLGLLGSVCTLKTALGYYRVHGSNGWMNTNNQNNRLENQMLYCRFVNEKLMEMGREERVQFKKSSLYQDILKDNTWKSEPVAGLELAREQKANLNESLFISRLLQIKSNRGVMVDVGAHYGGSLSPYARAGWRILGFEPDPVNRAKLFQKWFVSLPDVEIVSAAVGASELDEVVIYSSEESSGISSLTAFRDTHTEAAKVPLVTLKKELARRDISKVSFLKVDVEGHEMDVLRGFDFEAVDVDVFLLEFEDQKTLPHGYVAEDLAYLLKNNGYQVFVSEWWPIEAYGTNHSWKSLRTFPCEISESCWGNLIAWKSPPKLERIADVLTKTVHVPPPEVGPVETGVVEPEEVTDGPAPAEVSMSQAKSFGKWLPGFLKRNPATSAFMSLFLIASFIAPGYFPDIIGLELLPFVALPIVLAIALLEYSCYGNRFISNQFAVQQGERDLVVGKRFETVETTIARLDARLVQGAQKLDGLVEEKNLILSNLIELKSRYQAQALLDAEAKQDFLSSVDQLESTCQSLGQSIKANDTKLRRDLGAMEKSAETRFSELEENLRKVQSLADALEKDVSSLGTKLSQQKADFKDDINRETQFALETRETLMELSSDHQAIAKGLGEAQSLIQQVTQDLQSTQKSLVETRTDVKQSKDEIERSKTDIKQSRTDIDESRTVLELTKANLGEFVEQINQVKGQIENNVGDLNKLFEEAKHLQADSGQNTQKIAATNKQLGEVQTRLKGLDEMDAKLKQVDKELTHALERIDSNKSGLSSMGDLQKKSELALNTLKAANSNLQGLFLHMNGANAARARLHRRFLTNDDSKLFLKKWVKEFKLNYSARTLSYLAHQICNLENQAEGRMASDISTALLRTLALQSIKKKSLNVLEIGSLFGVGAATLFKYGATGPSKIHLTIIDPLDGYYKDFAKDPITGVRVDRKQLEDNFSKSGMDAEDYEIIQKFSEDKEAIELASQRRYDLIIIDGDHSYEGVKRDFENYFPLLKFRGLVIFDDYDNDEWPDIKRYVDDLYSKRKDIDLVGYDWKTCIFRKKAVRSKKS